MPQPKFDIAAAFRNKETAMRASFLAIRDVTAHPTTAYAFDEHCRTAGVKDRRSLLPGRWAA